MKFKTKLCTKFLTDAEAQEHRQQGNNLKLRIISAPKISHSSKTKQVKKVRKYKRRKRFETEDEDDIHSNQQISHKQQESETPIGQPQIQKCSLLSNQNSQKKQNNSDADFGLNQVQSSQNFINIIKSKLKKQDSQKLNNL